MHNYPLVILHICIFFLSPEEAQRVEFPYCFFLFSLFLLCFFSFYRLFVKEGTIYKAGQDFSDPIERYVFLCSDVLLIAQVKLH